MDASMTSHSPLKMFKRPTIRRRYESVRFVTETSVSGAKVSHWVPDTTSCRIPTGTPGVLGSIVDRMHAGDDAVRFASRPQWTPSCEYEFIAKQLPVGEQAAYIARCEAWFAENPTRAAAPRPEALAVDYESVARVFAKRAPQLPPLEERLAVYRKAGYSEEYIERAKARAAMMEATSDARQKALDLIFAKWPAASKPAPKKGKVIKAVKKRMPIQDA
jgi:hypothetical protein